MQCGLSAVRARARVGVIGYWYTHLVMLAGIVLPGGGSSRKSSQKGASARVVSIGARQRSGDVSRGDALFREVLRIQPLLFRAVAALAAIPLGVIGGVHELSLLALLLIAMLGVEHFADRERFSQ